MLRSKRSEVLTAAVLMAPFVVIYGVLFVYPTVKMVRAQPDQRAADRSGQMGRARQLFPARVGPSVLTSRSGTRSISSSCRSFPARFWRSWSRSA